MSEPFVPLLPKSFTSASTESQQFKPQMPPAKVKPSSVPGATEKHSASCSSTPNSSGQDQPKITLQHEGDRIVGIRIDCICGQVIELACGY